MSPSVNAQDCGNLDCDSLLPIPWVIGLCSAPILVVLAFYSKILLMALLLLYLNHCRRRQGVMDRPPEYPPNLLRGLLSPAHNE